MTTELYINGRRVDLSNSAVIALSYAVNSLYEVKTIQGNVSNRIVLLPTANNMEACGFAGSMNVDYSKTLRKRLTCRYVQNGVEVITVGYVEISSIDDKGISILITSGNTDFFDLVTGNINELDMSDLDHIWDAQTVIASRLNTKGYIYPIIDYGNLLPTSTNADPRMMRPAVFFSTIANKIFAETGYRLINELETRLETKDIYANMILPFSVDDFLHSKRYLDKYANQNIDVSRTGGDQRYNQNNQVLQYVRFDTKTADVQNLFDGINFHANRIMNVNVKVNFPSVHVSKTLLAGRQGTYMRLYKNEEILQEINWRVASGSGYDYKDQIFQVANLALSPGDVLRMAFYIQDRGDLVIGNGARFQVETTTDKMVFGQDVQLEATLPDMSKKDFLKFLSSLFCAIIQTDNTNRTVRIVPFARIKDNVAIHRDWSDKIVDTGSSKTLTIGDYAQQNTASWDNDDAITPEGYASANLLIADENIPVKKELFTAPFSASFDVLVFGGFRTMQIKKISDIAIGDFDVTTGPRIGVLDRTETTLAYGNTNAVGKIPFVYFASGSDNKPDLLMSNVLKRSYADLIIVLNDQRRIACQLTLTELDIASLDFFIPVYIAKFGCYFYIASIGDYVGERPSKVELIKLY